MASSRTESNALLRLRATATNQSERGLSPRPDRQDIGHFKVLRCEPAVIRDVPTDLVPDLWPAIEKHVEAACAYHPFMEALDVARLIMKGHARLFVSFEGGAVQGFAAMEVVQYPRRKVANVLAAGGDTGFLSVAIHDLLPILKQWGREQGADTFAISGRPGWLKALQHEDGQAVHLVTWSTRLGNVEGRRKLQESDANHDQRTVETGAALSH
jgi:hypothetical protein